MKPSHLTPLTALVLFTSIASAHDTWVETHTNLIRTGDAVYIDLKLGNHGNEHRDFRLASKIGLEDCTLDVLDPAGKPYDLKPRLVDTGYAPKEGYWTGKFVAAAPGLYTVAHTLDKVVNHGRPIRAIKSGKAYFAVSPSLDRPDPESATGFDRPLGHPFEIVPQTSPVLPMGPGQPLKVRLLFKGKPMANTRISFIPRSDELTEDFDESYERMTDENGLATFTPKTGDQYLVVAHHTAEDESSDEYDLTAYAATLCVFVPEICPCCGE
ncbi:MAG: DUF4198 domain-containing protein [Maioricimonas sp. JB045]